MFPRRGNYAKETMKCLVCGKDRDNEQKYRSNCGSPVVRRFRRTGLRDFMLVTAFVIVVVASLAAKQR